MFVSASCVAVGAGGTPVKIRASVDTSPELLLDQTVPTVRGKRGYSNWDVNFTTPAGLPLEIWVHYDARAAVGEVRVSSAGHKLLHLGGFHPPFSVTLWLSTDEQLTVSVMD
jgi:hypothetical protein